MLRMTDVICPWMNNEEKQPDDHRRYVSTILDAPVSFFMKGGVIYCSVHGLGKDYPLKNMEKMHPELCKKVKEFFEV